MDQHGIVITTNKVASLLDLQTIERYVKIQTILTLMLLRCPIFLN